MLFLPNFFICFFTLLILSTKKATSKLPEDERVRRWYERGNTWPPNWTENQNDSDEYRAHMAAREKEIMQLTGGDERWENWMQFTQAYMLPKFTETGFDKIPTPKHLHDKLYAAVMEGIQKWDSLRTEDQVADSIYGPTPPKFVDLGALKDEVLHDETLRKLHEEWAGGLDLEPTSGYGVRLYRNGSSMVMHNDKPHTHVISSIIHIAHEYWDNSEPWTIEIEDHNGKLHSVVLEEGEMMFYESAKCLHGRMTALKGKYFGSIFIHYKPTDPEIWNYDVNNVISNVPPHWREGVTEYHGSRWAGQAITTDSRVVEGAPPRVFGSFIDHEERAKEDSDRQDPYDEYDEL